MSRPPLPIGTWGSISTKVIKTDKNGKPVKHQSQTKFRDHDGHVRQVSAVGTSKTCAENALQKKLQDRARTNQSRELTAMHKINHLLDLWERRFEGLIADGKRSPTSGHLPARPEEPRPPRPRGRGVAHVQSTAKQRNGGGISQTIVRAFGLR